MVATKSQKDEEVKSDPILKPLNQPEFTDSPKAMNKGETQNHFDEADKLFGPERKSIDGVLIDGNDSNLQTKIIKDSPFDFNFPA